MKHQVQKRAHDKAVREKRKVYQYYLEHTENESQDEIAAHFGHSREWLRQIIKDAREGKL
jgi:DNA-binding transcriptional regulator LsrR (DeoR family)